MEANNHTHHYNQTASSSQHGLLLIVIPDFEAPLGDTCSSIHQALGLVDRLTIVVSVHSPTTITCNGSKAAAASFHSVQKVLSALYVSFTKQAVALGRPLAELDIVIRESCGYDVGAGGVGDEIPFTVFLGLPPGKFFFWFLFCLLNVEDRKQQFMRCDLFNAPKAPSDKSIPVGILPALFIVLFTRPLNNHPFPVCHVFVP
jgi:hypothetical protein